MAARRPSAGTPVSERAFYLEEFRGRTLAIACSASQLRDPTPLRQVVDLLVRHGTQVVVLSTRAGPLPAATGGAILSLTPSQVESSGAALVWRGLRRSGRLAVVLTGRGPFGARVQALVARMQTFKLVWIDPSGGFPSKRGTTLSFVDRRELRDLLQTRPPRAVLLRQIDRLLASGVETVNVCTLTHLDQELLTYEGAGTLFTHDRYVEVRRLGIDDFDAAHDLIARGVREGFLLRRSRADVDRLLAAGFGAFVEGRDLAGVGTLIDHGVRGEGEIAALYTLTRFLGEGVGAELVRHALREARAARMARVYACTTWPRVGRFFERQGFRYVPATELPERKLRGYSARRLSQLRCYRRRP